jgi:hypothetical protein
MKKKQNIKLLTVKQQRKTRRSTGPETAAQCCAKASKLVAGCHD